MRNSQVADKFVNKESGKSSNGNFSVRDDGLYSYEMRIAKWNLKRNIVEILNFPEASVTTKGHQTELIHALNKNNVSHVYVNAIESRDDYQKGSINPEYVPYYEFPDYGYAYDETKELSKKEFNHIVSHWNRVNFIPPYLAHYDNHSGVATFHYAYDENLGDVDYQNVISIDCPECDGKGFTWDGKDITSNKKCRKCWQDGQITVLNHSVKLALE